MEKETSGGAELETAFPSSDTLTVRLKRLVTRVRRAGAAAGTRAWGGGGGAEEEEEEEEEAPRAKKARRAPPPPASGGVWIQKKKRPEVVRALMVCGPPTDERDWLRLAARMGEAQPSASLRQSAADCLGAAAEAAQVAPRGAYITLPPALPCVRLTPCRRSLTGKAKRGKSRSRQSAAEYDIIPDSMARSLARRVAQFGRLRAGADLLAAAAAPLPALWWRPAEHDPAMVRGLLAHGWGSWAAMWADPGLPFAQAGERPPDKVLAQRAAQLAAGEGGEEEDQEEMEEM